MNDGKNGQYDNRSIEKNVLISEGKNRRKWKFSSFGCRSMWTIAEPKSLRMVSTANLIGSIEYKMLAQFFQ